MEGQGQPHEKRTVARRYWLELGHGALQLPAEMIQLPGHKAGQSERQETIPGAGVRGTYRGTIFYWEFSAQEINKLYCHPGEVICHDGTVL